MKYWRWVILGFVCCVLAAGGLVLPAGAHALRAANYGYDWSGSPYYNIDVYDAASRSAYYQGLMGYTTMSRDRGTGANIYEKLAGTDPNTYQVINIISHSGPEHILARPEGGDAYMSCLYESEFPITEEHDHGVLNRLTNKIVYRYTVDRGRIQALTSGTPVRWLMLQGCRSAGEYQAYSSNLAYHAHDNGVDTVSGFFAEVWLSDSVVPGSLNGKTYQYNFAAKYWKSLYEGKRNSVALNDAVDQVKREHGWSGGYQAHRYYGVDGTLN